MPKRINSTASVTSKKRKIVIITPTTDGLELFLSLPSEIFSLLLGFCHENTPASVIHLFHCSMELRDRFYEQFFEYLCYRPRTRPTLGVPRMITLKNNKKIELKNAVKRVVFTQRYYAEPLDEFENVTYARYTAKVDSEIQYGFYFAVKMSTLIMRTAFIPTIYPIILTKLDIKFEGVPKPIKLDCIPKMLTYLSLVGSIYLEQNKEHPLPQCLHTLKLGLDTDSTPLVIKGSHWPQSLKVLELSKVCFDHQRSPLPDQVESLYLHAGAVSEVNWRSLPKLPKALKEFTTNMTVLDSIAQATQLVKLTLNRRNYVAIAAVPIPLPDSIEEMTLDRPISTPNNRLPAALKKLILYKDIQTNSYPQTPPIKPEVEVKCMSY